MNKKVKVFISMLSILFIVSNFINLSSARAIEVKQGEIVEQTGNLDEKVTDDGFKYIVQSDGTIGISGYTGDKTEIVIPNKINNSDVTKIGDYSFARLNTITKIQLPESITIIGESAFNECTNLKQINIPASVENICDAAFFNCSSLTSIQLAKSIKWIGEYEFVGCSSLINIIVDKENENWCDVDGVLYNKDKTTLECYPAAKQAEKYVILNSTTRISFMAFKGCSTLKNIEIPDGVQSIGYGVFEGCSGLTRIKIPNSLKRLSDGIFRGCTGLTSIEIPSNIDYISNFAFEGCTSLKSVQIPTNVDIIGGGVFNGCSNLTNISVSKDNLSYCDVDGVLFNKYGKEKTVLLAYPNGKTDESYIVPNTVTNIDGYAFNGCSNLKRVEILSNVKYIEIPSNALNPKTVSTVFEGCKDIEIYGEAGSQIESYAKKYNLNFKIKGQEQPVNTTTSTVSDVNNKEKPASSTTNTDGTQLATDTTSNTNIKTVNSGDLSEIGMVIPLLLGALGTIGFKKRNK